MSYFVILTGDGNLVESFDSEGEARASLEQIARQDPDAASEYAMIEYDDAGLPLGNAVSASDLHVGA